MRAHDIFRGVLPLKTEQVRESLWPRCSPLGTVKGWIEGATGISRFKEIEIDWLVSQYVREEDISASKSIINLIRVITHSWSNVLPITATAVAPSARCPFEFLAVQEYVPRSLSFETASISRVPFGKTFALGPLDRG